MKESVYKQEDGEYALRTRREAGGEDSVRDANVALPKVMKTTMEHWIEQLVVALPWWGLLVLIVMAFYGLSQGADMLVEEAVTLSVQWGVPKVLVGATIVSLGTTLPEAAVSVLAAIQGSPELALGNAVGSVICDTGLILGLAALISPLPLDRAIVNRQGWLQLGAGFLLVAACLPVASFSTIFDTGGRLPQGAGAVFLVLLVFYIWRSIGWSRGTNSDAVQEEITPNAAATVTILGKLVGGIVLLIGASWILIPAVREAALRLHIPPGIVAATLVAFGTSLPELVTAVTAALKRHGELAVGNVIGADILNVLFVAGAAAAVTQGGLSASAHFFRLLFPAMLLILIVFRIGIMVSGTQLRRPVGVLLIGVYLLVTILSYAYQPKTI